MPSIVRQPAAAASFSSFVRRGLYTASNTANPGRNSAGTTKLASSCGCMPIGEQCSSTSAAAISSASERSFSSPPSTADVPRRLCVCHQSIEFVQLNAQDAQPFGRRFAGQRHGDRPGRAAGPQHQNPFPLRIDARVAQRVQCPAPIRIVTDQLAVFVDHRVDAPDPLRGGIDPVDALHRLDLVRNRHRQSAIAHHAHPVQCPSDTARLDIMRHVHKGQPQFLERRVMHRRRKRMTDRVPEQSTDSGFGIDNWHGLIP
jgi:hypothetical protein